VAAVGEWVFGAEQAARVTAPLLLVDGEKTADVAMVKPESCARLASLLPHASHVVLAGATHLMPLEDPRGVGRLVAGFTHAHPMSHLTTSALR
jgi:pimeloyl-ACP methyl ester carboxylesterase